MLPFDRFDGSDALLGPEMRSTGEVMGIARDFPTAFAKAQAAAGAPLPSEGTAFITVTDSDKAACGRDRAAAARPRLPHRRHARDRRGDRAHGRPRRARSTRSARARRTSWTGSRTATSTSCVNTPTGSGARTDGLGDPPRRGGARHPVPDDAVGRAWRRRARSRAGRQGEAEVLSLQEMHAERAQIPAEPAPEPRQRRTSPRGRPRVCEALRAHGCAASSGWPSSAPTGCCAVEDPDGPAPRPGSSTMLAAARAVGRGRRRATVPAARLLRSARAPRAGALRLEFLLEDVGPGTRRLCELRAGDGLDVLGPARPGLRRAAEDGRRALLVRRRRRHRAAGDLAGRAAGPRRARARAAGLPRRRARRRRRAAARRARRHRRRLGRPPRPRHRAARRGARRATRHAVVYACGPRPDARGGAGAVRRARRAGAARARVGHGVRLRRLLRLRRAAARAAATCASASTAPCSTRPSSSSPRCAGRIRPRGGASAGMRLAHPIVNGSGTFDAIAAATGLRRGAASSASRSRRSCPRRSRWSRARATRRRGCGRRRPG